MHYFFSVLATLLIFFHVCFRAEEDERVAKGLMQEELIHNQAQKIALELTDEV